MKAYILDGKEPKVVDAVPEHGEDFCDQCGDCLDCYAVDPCWHSSGEHAWIVYEDQAEEFRRRMCL